LSESLEDREKEIIEAALAESKGRVAGPNGAAARLGIPRSTLDWKIRNLKINRHNSRQCRADRGLSAPQCCGIAQMLRPTLPPLRYQSMIGAPANEEHRQ